MSKKAVVKKETEISEKDKKTFAARVKKAMKGRDVRQVVHSINNEFPDLRTLEVSERVEKVIAGKLFDKKILEAIEAIED